MRSVVDSRVPLTRYPVATGGVFATAQTRADLETVVVPQQLEPVDRCTHISGS